MNSHFISIYLRELRTECGYALAAKRHLDIAVPRSADDAFFLLHAALGHAANASKILWPSADRRSAARRGAQLQALLGIVSDHPLACRKLRNHLEHFDERLDRWAQTTRDANFFDRFIGPPGMIKIESDQPDPIMRHYDPATADAYFMGEKCSVLELMGGCQDVLSRITAFAQASTDWPIRSLVR